MIDFAEHPADGSIPRADQYPEGVKVAEEAQSQSGTGRDQVEHLGWVEQLLEAPQELDALVVAGLGVDEDQQRREAAVGFADVPGVVDADRVQRGGRNDRNPGRPQRAVHQRLRTARRVDRRAAPEAAPVLQPHHRAARLVADHALGRHRQVALHPLVGHHDVLWEEMDIEPFRL